MYEGKKIREEIEGEGAKVEGNNIIFRKSMNLAFSMGYTCINIRKLDVYSSLLNFGKIP